MRVSESIGPQLPQPSLLPPPTATLFSFFVAGRSFSGCASRLERPTAEGTSGSAFSLGNCLISDLVVDKTDDKNAFLRQLGVSVILEAVDCWNITNIMLQLKTNYAGPLRPFGYADLCRYGIFVESSYCL